MRRLRGIEKLTCPGCLKARCRARVWRGNLLLVYLFWTHQLLYLSRNQINLKPSSSSRFIMPIFIFHRMTSWNMDVLENLQSHSQSFDKCKIPRLKPISLGNSTWSFSITKALTEVQMLIYQMLTNPLMKITIIFSGILFYWRFVLLSLPSSFSLGSNHNHEFAYFLFTYMYTHTWYMILF